MSPFDIMNDLGRKKYSQEEVESNLNIYLFLQYLKCHPFSCPMAEYLNNNWNLDIYQMYLFAYHMLLGKNISIKWIKTEKIKKDEDVELIQMHYQCSRQVATEYLDIIPDDDFKRLKRMYQYGSMKGNK